MRVRAAATLFGAAFGFLISWGQFSDPDRIRDMLLLRDPYLYLMMLWMFVNFYAISLSRRPWRVLSAIGSLFTGREDTRLAKWLNDVFVVRLRWNRQFKKLAAERSGS